jgi:hypothetical protein
MVILPARRYASAIWYRRVFVVLFWSLSVSISQSLEGFEDHQRRTEMKILRLHALDFVYEIVIEGSSFFLGLRSGQLSYRCPPSLQLEHRLPSLTLPSFGAGCGFAS